MVQNRCRRVCTLHYANTNANTCQGQNGLSIMYLYSTADKKITAVTSDLVNGNGAVFDPEGNYVYFQSDRDYNEVLWQLRFRIRQSQNHATLFSPNRRIHTASFRQPDNRPSPHPKHCRASRRCWIDSSSKRSCRFCNGNGTRGFPITATVFDQEDPPRSPSRKVKIPEWRRFFLNRQSLLHMPIILGDFVDQFLADHISWMTANYTD
jgi:hypothetical protein